MHSDDTGEDYKTVLQFNAVPDLVLACQDAVAALVLNAVDALSPSDQAS